MITPIFSAKLKVHKEEEEEEEEGGGNQEVVKERMVAPLSLIRTRLPALPTVEPSLRLSTPSHPADAIPPLLIDLSQLCHLFRGNFFQLPSQPIKMRARGIMEFCSFAGLASAGLVNCICV